MSKAPSPMRSLAELACIKGEMTVRAEREREQALVRDQRLAREASARDLFARAAGDVQALPARSQRAQTRSAPPPEPVPRQHLRDEQAALRESLSDEFDITTLLEIDDQMSFRRPGIGSDVTAKLRKGHWSIQAALDLHGMRRDDAREALGAFLREARAAGLRCVRIVHGKGLGSPGKTPVLKNRVLGWLVQKAEVLAFVQARPAEGGAGAVVVLLHAATPMPERPRQPR